nr:hypothetical protein CFP56_19102 [Quercus suber]POF09861.1 hypothetical protein CFP56_74020 [Quercus suber]
MAKDPRLQQINIAIPVFLASLPPKVTHQVELPTQSVTKEEATSSHSTPDEEIVRVIEVLNFEEDFEGEGNRGRSKSPGYRSLPGLLSSSMDRGIELGWSRSSLRSEEDGECFLPFSTMNSSPTSLPTSAITQLVGMGTTKATLDPTKASKEKDASQGKEVEHSEPPPTTKTNPPPSTSS